jgi:5-methylcytosine-specific restriction endonuclease McrA
LVYREWRDAVFHRDNFTCQKCGGGAGGNLNAHHLKPFQQIIDEYKITTVEQAIACAELWDIWNGITLCKTCHDKIHTKE